MYSVNQKILQSQFHGLSDTPNMLRYTLGGMKPSTNVVSRRPLKSRTFMRLKFERKLPGMKEIEFRDRLRVCREFMLL